jgi:hypothetical protein
MTRSGVVPQTVGEAKQFGWAWLSPKCLTCRHRADLKLAELPGSENVRLGVVASKLFCGKCKGRRLEFTLGAYVSDAGQLWPQRKRIDFQGTTAVMPSRE